jgi:hypothetical protein
MSRHLPHLHLHQPQQPRWPHRQQLPATQKPKGQFNLTLLSSLLLNVPPLFGLLQFVCLLFAMIILCIAQHSQTKQESIQRSRRWKLNLNVMTGILLLFLCGDVMHRTQE